MSFSLQDCTRLVTLALVLFEQGCDLDSSFGGSAKCGIVGQRSRGFHFEKRGLGPGKRIFRRSGRRHPYGVFKVGSMGERAGLVFWV